MINCSLVRVDGEKTFRKSEKLQEIQESTKALDSRMAMRMGGCE